MQTDFSRFSYSPRMFWFRDILSKKSKFGACAITGYCPFKPKVNASFEIFRCSNCSRRICRSTISPPSLIGTTKLNSLKSSRDGHERFSLNPHDSIQRISIWAHNLLNTSAYFIIGILLLSRLHLYEKFEMKEQGLRTKEKEKQTNKRTKWIFYQVFVNKLKSKSNRRTIDATTQ